MDQRKYGDIRPNSQRDREDHCSGKARRLPKLAQRNRKILHS